MADPFDTTNTDQPNASGALGISPDAWRNLLAFGAATLTAANARTPQGFLQYGAGAAGPLGAGVQGAMASNLENAKARSALGYQNATTQNQLADLQLKRLQVPFMQQRLQAIQDPELWGGAAPQLPMSPPQQGASSTAAPSSTVAADQTLAIPADFRTAIQGIEKPAAGASPFNKQGYVGNYQMGASALADAGMYTPAQGEDLSKNEWKGQVNVPGIGAMSPQQFALNPEAQEIAFGQHIGNLSQKAQALGLNNYVGQTVAGVPITQETLAGMMHFAGPGGTQRFLQTGGQFNPSDANGTSVAGYGLNVAKRLGQTGQQYAQAGNVATDASGAPPASPQQHLPPQPSQGGAPQIRIQQPQPDPQAMALAQHFYGIAQKQAFAGLPNTAALQQAQTYQELALAGPKASATTSATQAAELPYVGPKKAAETAEAITQDRFGNMYKGTTFLGRGSEVKPVWDAASGQMRYGDVGALGIGRPENLPGGNAEATPGPAEAPPPMQASFMRERGTHLANQRDKIDADAAQATESNYLFDNMRNDSKTWDMGKFADSEGNARAYLSAIAQSFGVATPELNQKLADYQTFNKSAGMLLRTAVHDTSSRAAVQEYSLIGNTLPQPTTSSQAFGQIADQWQGLSDYRIAKQKFAENFQGSPQDFNVAVNSNVSPSSFMLNRMAQTPQGQQDMQRMLSQMSSTPQGKLMAGRLLQHYDYAKQQGLFNDLPPPGAPAPGGQ